MPSFKEEERPTQGNDGLATLLMEMGKDPSLNLVSILEFGPAYLGCEHLHYTESAPHSLKSSEEIMEFPVFGSKKKLTLYGIKVQPAPERLQIYCALLAQQERRLNDVLKMRSLKSYSKTLFENYPDGMVLLDEKGYIINTNRAMVALSRRPLRNLIGLRVSKIIEREGLTTSFSAIRKLNTQPKTIFDCRIRVGAGRSILVSVSFSDLVIQEQRLFLATVRDLSHWKQELAQRGHYESSLANSIKNADDGFARYDEFGRITDTNNSIKEWTGFSSSQLLGRPIDDLFSNNSLRNFRRAVSQLNKSGYSSFKCAIKAGDGSEFPSYGTLMQLEIEGVRSCRLMLQKKQKWGESDD